MSSVQIIKKGIAKLEVDAIINAANSQLQDRGGVCGNRRYTFMTSTKG